ncbi:hypothetical protein VSY18_19245 [Bacillus albus]|uniref:hypothetical protein n=1 Tax=Bacillus cereus group TaxID=86661 RepID=UPI0022DF7019|nr:MULTISPECIES: hypothetical protein [Bacillus cereus group]MDA2216917.1 hypothetical protein [Bacillus cereus group sp. Bc228]MDA2226198.1 hypothetical protein [Bacillus cereus group sp. Bc227]
MKPTELTPEKIAEMSKNVEDLQSNMVAIQNNMLGMLNNNITIIIAVAGLMFTILGIVAAFLIYRMQQDNKGYINEASKTIEKANNSIELMNERYLELEEKLDVGNKVLDLQRGITLQFAKVNLSFMAFKSLYEFIIELHPSKKEAKELTGLELKYHRLQSAIQIVILSIEQDGSIEKLQQQYDSLLELEVDLSKLQTEASALLNAYEEVAATTKNNN